MGGLQPSRPGSHTLAAPASAQASPMVEHPAVLGRERGIGRERLGEMGGEEDTTEVQGRRLRNVL